MILITYFYQVRNLTHNQIPLSTAMFDPKWYHDNKGNRHKYVDKRGVINGLRCEPLVPNETLKDLCRGREGQGTVCQGNPTNCSFLTGYRGQLQRLNIESLRRWWSELSQRIEKVTGTPQESLQPVLLVHEKPDNPCSERTIIREWLNKEGIENEELTGRNK